jgi:spermidine/putrescine transport system permease protein
LARSAPLAVMLVYSFLKAGDYGGVVWQFSWEGWFNVFMQRDIFLRRADLRRCSPVIFGRSVTLSLLTTISALILGLPTAYFIATSPPQSRNFWLFLITIPFWTNLLIRTFAIMELIRAQGTINTTLAGWG